MLQKAQTAREPAAPNPSAGRPGLVCERKGRLFFRDGTVMPSPLGSNSCLWGCDQITKYSVRFSSARFDALVLWSRGRECTKVVRCGWVIQASAWPRVKFAYASEGRSQQTSSAAKGLSTSRHGISRRFDARHGVESCRTGR